MGRASLRLLLALVCGIAVAACGSTPSTSSKPQAPPPFYRVTGLIRASCFIAPPDVGQGFCTLHAQIQNEGGPGRGGIAELILQYHPKDSNEFVNATCEASFPALDSKDVAELDCFVRGNPPIYSTRIVSTEIKFLPPGSA